MVYLTLIIVILSVLIISFNVINIAVLYKTRQLPPNSRYFMLSLAVADLGVGILSTLGIYPSAIGYWPYSEPVCRFLGGWWNMSCGVSIYSLVCISIERYMAINFPLRYHSYVTGRRCAVSIVLMWAINLFWATFLSTLTNPVHYSYSAGSYMCVPGCTADKCRAFVLTGAVFYVIIPATLMPCIYSNIIYVSHKHQKRLQTRRGNQNGDQRNRDSVEIRVEGQTKRNFRAAKLSCVVTGAFYVSWIPLAVTTSTGMVTPPYVEFIVTWLAFSNSLWNFVIYSVMSKGFRSTLVRSFKTVFLKKTYVEPFTSDSRSIENGIKTIG